MLDSNIELYGPYVSMTESFLAGVPAFFCVRLWTDLMWVFCDDLQARPLLNCAGGGTCATCMVEVSFFSAFLFSGCGF